ncbi:MAG TPA: hypothetical protein VFZ09_27100 [Archangium sp.]|uniref:hypothetical protein n=1 Tax=Archangium sp. TaxID=1872627 RepID=UPI002E34D614|nr:hypothetical protein [Archangium sp.]HEX5749928.1 hypothetical protein [Archangium sp.]
MSFLHRVRLVFSGTFQADVSTVNNDVRHFDNATFEPSFQEFQSKSGLNGWWNPTGSGAFRLLDCRVTGVWYEDGSFTDDPKRDPVIGMLIGGSTERTSGKLVDIDPQWQLASAPWGLEVRLTDGKVPAFFGGRYQPHAFRDLWFMRTQGQANDMAASSSFQSVLEEVTWDKDGLRSSPFLRQLQAATTGKRLSIRMATFGYQGKASHPRFTLGTVVGTLGPYLPGEPSSFVLGRRFTPASNVTAPDGSNLPISWTGITYFSGQVDAASRTLFLDLSNALPITDGTGTSSDMGRLSVGILRDAAIQENTPVTPKTFDVVAEIPYRDPRWLHTSGGVFAATLTPEQLERARELPLALVVNATPNPGNTGLDLGHGVVAIRESADGLFTCAEPAVHRIDGAGETRVTIYATRYGAPHKATIQLAQLGRIPNQGGGSPGDPNAPKAPIPDIGVPMEAVQLPEPPQTSKKDGKVEIRITTSDPKNPRKYIDGQIYLIDYRLPGQGNTARSPYDYIVLHVRDAFKAPARPTWEKHIQPIFVQYGNLYPIMSNRLVKLSDLESVKRHANLLELAFSLDIHNPNYMPVTRDLSKPKQRMIIQWLKQLSQQEEHPLGVVPPARTAAAPSPAAPETRAATTADTVDTSSSKTHFAKGFNRALGSTERKK